MEMSADLHIHVVVNDKDIPLVKEYVRHSFSTNRRGNAQNEWSFEYGYRQVWLDGKWVDYHWQEVPDGTPMRECFCKYSAKAMDDAIQRTEDIWVGEVSWLKAALFGDNETFIPSLIDIVSDTYPRYQLTEITDETIEKVAEAFLLKNNTKKKGGVWNGKGYSLAKKESIIEWLEARKGKLAFTISW